jgi:hypothetical protein
MMQHLTNHFTPSTVSRGVVNQQYYMLNEHIHRDLLEKALNLCRNPTHNILNVRANTVVIIVVVLVLVIRIVIVIVVAVAVVVIVIVIVVLVVIVYNLYYDYL